jgi:hypothetical protein
MTPSVRRTGIYDQVEAERVRQDAFHERCGLPPVSNPNTPVGNRIDHMKGLVGQLEGATDPERLLVAIAAQCVAWVEAIDQVEECRIDTGAEAA